MAIAFMIHYALRPESLFNAFFEFVHPKIYVVCLLGGLLELSSSQIPLLHLAMSAMAEDMS